MLARMVSLMASITARSMVSNRVPRTMVMASVVKTHGIITVTTHGTSLVSQPQDSMSRMLSRLLAVKKVLLKWTAMAMMTMVSISIMDSRPKATVKDMMSPKLMTPGTRVIASLRPAMAMLALLLAMSQLQAMVDTMQAMVDTTRTMVDKMLTMASKPLITAMEAMHPLITPTATSPSYTATVELRVIPTSASMLQRHPTLWLSLRT